MRPPGSAGLLMAACADIAVRHPRTQSSTPHDRASHAQPFARVKSVGNYLLQTPRCRAVPCAPLSLCGAPCIPATKRDNPACAAAILLSLCAGTVTGKQIPSPVRHWWFLTDRAQPWTALVLSGPAPSAGLVRRVLDRVRDALHHLRQDAREDRSDLHALLQDVLRRTVPRHARKAGASRK